jgi:predicted nucleic acid-binding protein
MKAVFVDTGYLFALEITNDQHHQAATQHWQRVVAALPRLVTTSYVFDEVVTFFNSRGQHAKALQVGNNLLQSRPYSSSTLIRRYFTKGGRISSAIRTRTTPSRIASLSWSCTSWASEGLLHSTSILSKQVS